MLKNSFCQSWAPHRETQRRKEVEMCVTFKSFPSHLAALEPQRVPLFAWHRSSQGHMATDWHRLAKGDREREVEWVRGRGRWRHSRVERKEKEHVKK